MSTADYHVFAMSRSPSRNSSSKIWGYGSSNWPHPNRAAERPRVSKDGQGLRALGPSFERSGLRPSLLRTRAHSAGAAASQQRFDRRVDAELLVERAATAVAIDISTPFCCASSTSAAAVNAPSATACCGARRGPQARRQARRRRVHGARAGRACRREGRRHADRNRGRGRDRRNAERRCGDRVAAHKAVPGRITTAAAAPALRPTASARRSASSHRRDSPPCSGSQAPCRA